MHRGRADTLRLHHAAPEALVHEEQPGDGDRPPRAQRLHCRAEAAVHLVRVRVRVRVRVGVRVRVRIRVRIRFRDRVRVRVRVRPPCTL